MIVALGAVVVAGGVGLLLGNTIGLRDSANTALTQAVYVRDVVQVERLVVDAETGLRGYVLTNRTLFLAPLRAAEVASPTAIGALERIARQTDIARGQVNTLVADVQGYFGSYVSDVLRLASSRAALARSYGVTLAGKQRVDGIRAVTGALEQTLLARQTASQHHARHEAQISITEAIVVLIALTLFSVLIGSGLTGLVLQRDRARKLSERTALTLQESILPEGAPPVPGCEVATRFHPAGAGELVGGDFYDVFEVAPDRWIVIVGDVCGKGAPAAAVTAMARWTLRALADSAMTPAEALRALNTRMLEQDWNARFLTIAYAALTVGPDAVRASVACAGHPPPVRIPADGPAEALPVSGDIVGVWDDIRLVTDEVELARGESLVLFTDGVTDQGPVTEATGDPAIALDRRGPDAGADELAEIVDRLAHAGGPPRDDIAIVAVRFVGSGEPGHPQPGSADRGAAAVAAPDGHTT